MGIDGDEVLVSLGNLTLIMDQANSYAFTGDVENDGRLYVDSGGKKLLVGLVMHEVYKGNGRRKVDPFVGLNAADMKSVRGVVLDGAPSEQVIELLGHLELQKVFFRVTDKAGVGSPKGLPAIPGTAMFLDIDQGSSDGIKDYSHLKSLSSLVYLSMDSLGGAQLDIKAIANNRNLAYLDLGGERFESPQALGQLQKLRHLNLSGCDKLTDSGFLCKLAELRELLIPGTGIADLTPLEGLEKVSKVNASMSPVEALPKKRVAGLRQLNVIATRLTEEQVAAFRETNPQCLVQYGWTSTLRAALEGVDRIRVRSGGTCHRNVGQEKTLFEIVDAKDVNGTIASIVLEPSVSGFHCMCCGSPSFEFYKQGKHVVTLGFHHGRSLRWMNGDWPGDALLSSKSGDSLCELLARHGLEDPLKERKEEKERDRAAEARMAKYREVLPDGIAKRLSKARSAADAVSAFTEGEEDKGKRVSIALRVIGCHNGSWNQRSMLDPVAIAVLKNEVPSDVVPGNGTPAKMKGAEKISASDIIAVLKANKQDAAIVRGTARWFVGEGMCGDIPAEEAGELLPLIVEAGVTHPRQVNRRWTLYALEELKSAAAIEELRKVLAGKFTSVRLKPEEEAEPGGMVEYAGRDGAIGDNCSDRALAGLILSRLGDRQSLAQIQALLRSEQEPESKKALQEAVILLEKGR